MKVISVSIEDINIRERRRKLLTVPPFHTYATKRAKASQ
jgi:hypothetical protein